ncbi:MAG: PAS domain S-box protein [Anaerolineales bacterium]
MVQNLKNIILRTALLYAILAGLWILVSDWAIYQLIDEPTALTRMQTYKGLFYVIVTTLLLYVLLRTQLRRWAKSVDVIEQAQQDLSESNDYLKAVLDATNDAILVVEPKSGKIIDANQRLFEMYGFSQEETVGKPIANLREIVLDYSLKKVYQWAVKVRRTGPQIIEWQTRHKDGHLFWVEVSLRFERIGAKNRFVMSVRDINKRREIEENLKENQRMLDTLISNLPGMVYRCQNSPDWPMNYVSQGVFALTGYRPEDLTGDNNISFIQLIHPEDRQRDWDKIQEALQMRRSYTLTYRLIDISNIEKWVWEQGRGIFDGNDELLFLEGFITDISKQKQAELALYKRFAELEALRTIDRAITSSFELRITLDILLKQAVHKLEVDAAAVLLLDSDLQALRYTAAQGFRAVEIESMEYRPGQGLAGRVMLERQPVQVSDQAEIENDKIFAKQEEFCGYCGIPLIAKGELKGILEIFHRASLPEDPDWRSFLETLANQTAIAIDNAQMFESLRHKNLELALAYDATIEVWSRALELRDGESPGHSERISQLTIRLAQALGLAKNMIGNIRYGVLLHDIGKMGVPYEILLKKGKLTKAEREIMQEHPRHAYKLLANISYLKHALDIPYHHHEKWDGTGYPDGLSGSQIPLAARIFAVVDVWDALTSDRPYRKAWTRKKAIAYLGEQRGKHFDPEILDTFLNLIETEESG